MSYAKSMNFCCYCGSALSLKRLQEEDVERLWCSACSVAHYKNPTVLVAAFLHYEDTMLWTQRGIEPFKGLWAFPAGFAECGESLQQAAARELREETGIDIPSKAMIPMSVSSVVPIDQIYVVFRYQCSEAMAAKLTAETQAWGWYKREEAPWSAMAHPESKALIEQVYSAVESQRFFFRIGEMSNSGNCHQSYTLLDKINK